MKRKLFFVTFLMLLCSLGFGQAYHFPEVVNNGEYENNMNITTVISFDGEEQSNANLELGIFCGNEIRGRVFTQNIDGRQYARISVFGKTGEAFSFKVYDHNGSGKEWNHGCTITCNGYTEEYLSFNEEGYGSLADPCVINFTIPNHWTVNEYDYDSQIFLTAVVEIDEVELSNPNLELGAFCNGECRGSVKTDFTYEVNGVTRYYARMHIYGNTPEVNEPADVITFRLYNHATESEYENFIDVNTVTFDATENDIIGNIMSPLKVNFLTKPYVAEVNGKKYQELAEAFAAAQNGDEVKIIYAGTYALSTSGKDLTITATVDGVEFANIVAHGMGGANVTFNNVTFTYADNSTYKGLQHSGNLVYNDCTFNGQVFLYGASETFNGCTFNQTTDNYNVWTYGAKEVAFNECTFNSAGKSVLIYAEDASLINNVTVTGCTFNASAAVDGKAAIEMDSSLTAGINLTISNTTATGFGNGNVSGNSLWNNKKPITDQASFDKNNDITVKVNGTIVLEPTIGTITPGYTSTTSIWGEATSNAKESLVIKIYAGDELIGTTSLNDINNIIDGTKKLVTWSAQFDPNDDGSHWTTVWKNLTPEIQPTTVKLYIDGYLLATNNVQMNAPDNLNPVVWENIFVAKVGETYYTTVTKAINAAQAGQTVQTVQLLARTINEVIAPWAGDSQHTSEKSITIVGAENFGTTLTGGLYLGYDDSGCRAHTITIKGIVFEGKGILVAGQQNVVIEGNKFTNITDVVATSQSANANAISVIGKNINATVKNNVIENIAVAGINLRDVANATVEGNTITDTKHNAITITETAGDGEISVVKNKLSQWGLGEQKGRAIRISANKVVKINDNVMSHTAAPESFVKVTGLGTEEKTLDVDKNYWNGNNPIALFETDGKKDPVSYLLGYYETYEDNTLKNYVELSASVAKIGDKYYQTLEAAIAEPYTGTGWGNTIELLQDIELTGGYSDNTEGLRIEKSVTIDGKNKTINCGGFEKGIRIYNNGTDNSKINVIFKNVNIINNNPKGRCVDTRTGKISLMFNGGVHLTAEGTNSQPLTLGGSEILDRLVINGGSINSGESGYGIISFVPVQSGIVINSTSIITGYAAIYLKETVTGTTVRLDQGQYISTNRFHINSGDFGTVVVEGHNNNIGTAHSDVTIKAISADGADKASQAVYNIRGNNNTVWFNENATIETEGENAYFALVGATTTGNKFEVRKDGQGNIDTVLKTMVPVAEIGKYQFITIEEALRYVKDGGTIKLIGDAEMAETYVNNKSFTLDLNGNTLSTAFAEGSTTNHLYAFDNKGTLTITDSSDAKDGKINARGIFNHGTMTLENGTINAIDGNGGYAVRNYVGATFTMNGGTIATTLEDDNQVNNGGFDATTVRVDEGATFLMKAGTINNICDYTFAIENHGETSLLAGSVKSVHSTVSNYGTMTINGGSFTCDGLEGITAHALIAWDGSTTNITGGTFDGKDNYNGFNVYAEAGANVVITGGEFLPVHSGSLYGEGTIKVSGGTFFDRVYKERLADGYTCVKEDEQKYTVYPISGEIPYRAYIGDESDRESVKVDLKNVYAGESLVVKLYDADNNLLTTTSLKQGGVKAPEYYTCNIVLCGNPSSSWETEINAEKLTVDNIPATIKLYIDGILVDTFENAFGAGTNSDVTAQYIALDCVYKEAKIDNKYYASIKDAFAEAQNNDVITVLTNIELAEKLTVANKAITLDLNGKTISGICNAGQSSLIFVENNAALTVKDEATGGKITYAQGSSNVGWTVDVKGAFTLESGTIELTGEWNIGYAVDVRPNSWGTEYTNPTVFTMKGGNIVSSDGGVRVASSSAAAHTAVASSFVMNGGEIDAAWDGVFVQQSDATYDVLNFTINGGTIKSGLNPVRVYGPAATGYVNGQDCMSIKFLGGEMSYTGNETLEWIIEGILRVGGGSSIETILESGNITASEAFAQANELPEGYSWSKNNDNTYSVAYAVAKITVDNETKYYPTLQEAVNAANGSTVTVIMDFAETYTMNDGIVAVIDLNGKTLTGSILAPNANLTVANGTIINNDKGVSAIEINAGKLTLNAVNISSERHAVRIDGAVTATIDGGTYKVLGSNKGTYYAANISGAANVKILNGTFVGPKGTSADSGSAVNVQSGATVTIEGGNFSGGKNSTLASKGTLTLTGGTYDQDVAAYCAPSYICVKDNDLYKVIRGLIGSGTETDPYLIRNLTELEYFNESVNKGETTYNQEGVWVALGADIDMTPVANWAPIGSFDVSYDGNFNGQGHKIMNLKMSDNVAATGESYLGFFGVTANNVIKDFVIENVTIESKGQIVAAAIAYPYYTTVSDITVCGDIAIKGGNYTAGVLAYTRLCVNASDLTVSGNSGSYITGTQVVGGVIADIQMNHGLVANYSNFSASGLEITGTMNVGGISGIISGQTLNGATVKNVTLNCSDARVGVVSGSMGATSTISTVFAENVTGATAIIGATYDYAKAIEARIVDTYYATLEAALLAEGNNVTLLVPYTVEADETVVLDLNGKTVTMEDASAATSAMIKNYGNLTISNGKLSFKATAPSANNAYASNTISNYGEITIESGIIENLSTGSACYALDNYAGSTATINGGKLTAEKTTVRVFNWTNGEANATTLNVNDGEIYSKDGYGINVNSGNAPYVALNIAGGTITTDDTDYNLAVYVVNKNSAENFTVNVTAGTFNGNFALNGVTSTTMATGNVSISGGAFEGVICYATPAYGFITGGAFVNDPSAFLAENYSAIYDDGIEYYIVKRTSGTQTREFTQGWNWFSSYINLSTSTGLEKLETALGTSGVQIKGQTNNQSATYEYLGEDENGNKLYAWLGSFTPSMGKMYMVKTSAPVTAQITGDFIDYEKTTIVLNKGWNWISYPLQEEVEINEALKYLEPTEGDVIKMYGNDFAEYYMGEWAGIETLKPGLGYMYKSAKSTSFVYSADEVVTTTSRSDDKAIDYRWTPEASEYAFNMSVIATLNVDGEMMSDGYEIAAFANGECRGSARPIYIEKLGQYMLFLTIYGDEVEELTFKCYDVNYGTEYELSNRFNYSSDAVLGSMAEPYMFNMNFLNIEESTLDMINIYPNPTTTDRAINLQATCDNVEVFNALGVKVAEYQNVDTIDALETAGVYVIRVTINGEIKHCRLVVE